MVDSAVVAAAVAAAAVAVLMFLSTQYAFCVINITDCS